MPGDLGDLSDLSIGLKMNEAGGIGKMKKRNTADKDKNGSHLKFLEPFAATELGIEHPTLADWTPGNLWSSVCFSTRIGFCIMANLIES